jgi:DNA-binding MarR family transcriptional regulator
MPDDAPSTAALLFIAHRWVENRIFEAVRAAGYTDVTLAQCRIAQRLSPDGIRLTELAEQAQVTKQTAGALVDELERNGYVTRRPDPADARARLVLLGDRGAEVCRTAGVELARIEEQWRDHLGDDAYRGLRAALSSLREITDPYR